VSATLSRSNFVTIIGLAFLALVLLAACASPEPQQVPIEESMPAPTMVPLPASAVPETASDNLGSLAERMIVCNTDLAMQVEDTQKALDQIQAVAADLNGYLVSTNLWRADAQLRGTVTIRIPAESFNRAMQRLNKLALEVHWLTQTALYA
jgi:hypothetical protein